jgi:beta-lactamase class A
MLKKTLKLSLAFGLFASHLCVGQSQDSLRLKLKKVTQELKAEVGISMINLGNHDTLSINGTGHFPMQSVFKFHLALAVLNRVDHKHLDLDQKVHVAPEDIFPTWSPLAKKYPNGNVDITVKELLTYMVEQSDNIACDILFKLIGGPSSVHQYIHDLGIEDISIVVNERTMHSDWNIQFNNWTTPLATSDLLSRFFKGEFLSRSSHDLMWNAMVACSTGPRRIKGQLPPETIVAHRTGTGGPNEQNVLGAVNDIGIFKISNGDYIVLSVYMSRVSDEQSKAEAVIAAVAKLLYDYYSR